MKQEIYFLDVYNSKTRHFYNKHWYWTPQVNRTGNILQDAVFL